MTVHVSIDTGCNLGCDYCYEEPDRVESGNNIQKQYDLDAIFERLEEWHGKHGETPGLHGGEPLLIPIDDIEKIYSFIQERWGGESHIQTNGTLLRDEHLEIFEEYNVQIGISIDGPGELNQLRKARAQIDGGVEDVTDNMTTKTIHNIFKADAAGINVGIITVLHQKNAGTDEKLEKLLKFMDRLNQKGITGHFNPAIPYKDIQGDLSLSPERLKEVYLRTWEWMQEEDYREWDPMRQYQDNLIGAQLGNCVNQKCDVFNAGAAKIALGEGQTTGCGKTWSAVGDGVPFLQGDSADTEYDNDETRYDMLKQIPGPTTEGEPDMGGCKGCKLWNVCQGGCPSSGLDEDFRNRTRWCEAKYALYEKIEEDMRMMFPNITLITDLPWNANLSDLAKGWQLDIKPFSAMRPDVDGRSSVAKGHQHNLGEPLERVPTAILPHESWEDLKDLYIERYDEDQLIIDDEARTVEFKQ